LFTDLRRRQEDLPRWARAHFVIVPAQRVGMRPIRSQTRHMSSSLRVLAVCTHNRTRSVLIGSLLKEHTERERVPAVIRTAGFSDGGESPTDSTVRFLASRGIDVKGYLSHWMSDSGIAGADVIITAEHEHVVAIAGRWPDAFGYTFTLPELVERGEAVGPRGERTFQEWLTAVNLDRPNPLDYLDVTVGEVDDPTGRAPAVWQTSFAQIDDLTTRLAALLK
jgi:protein-tyrosine-phosphatase